jgi:hypothetical protein
MGAVEDLLASGLVLSDEAVVDDEGGEEGDAGVKVVVVVPVEEGAAMGPGGLEGGEAVGEVGPVLDGLEEGLGVGVVVADVRAAVGLGDAEVAVEP